MSTTANEIRKEIHLNAPIARVWRALTNHKEFGQWFRVNFDAPFVPGKTASGHITWPGYEHLKWNAVVQKMEPQKLFSFTWHPYSIDPNADCSTETPTLVEFHLKEANGGTHLVVIESGFDKIPAHRRDTAFLRNSEGWTIQMTNIDTYVKERP
jgi:uncharacterized protein YndB with AHSA1/START domain